jgi:hypothetical protein
MSCCSGGSVDEVVVHRDHIDEDLDDEVSAMKA